LRRRVLALFILSLILSSAACGLLGIVVNVDSQENAGSVVVVNFDVPVDPGSAGFVDAAVSYAIQQGASAIVFEMNTPGGLLSDMLSIVASITRANQSGIPSYTLVVPNGLAASAGSYIAMATNKILMGTGSAIGPSTPIVVGGSELEQNHTQAAMLSLMVSLAESWGRNSTAAYDMVQQDEAFSANQAVAFHVVDGFANSVDDVLRGVGLAGAAQVVRNESLYDQFISALSNPTLDGILILLGILAIILDIYHPTVILTIAGIIGIVTGLIGAEVIGASTLGYVILAIAAVLIALELKLGHGFAIIAGVAVGAFGIYYLAQGLNYSPSPITNVTELELFLVVVMGVVAGLYFRWIISPIIHRTKLTGPEAIIGKVGTAVTDLKPNGEVRVEGYVWRAKSSLGDIEKGESVRVKSLQNLVLIVEKPAKKPEADSKKETS
jgi:membrane-bound serine protease (ClpP class)